MSFSKALLTLLALTASTAAAQCTRNATVVAGDTCDSLSIQYASPTYQLALSNPSIDNRCHNLIPGEGVCLGMRGGDCAKVYKVVVGDTCSKISSTYGLGATTLWTNNPQISSTCDNIYIGEVLCVDTAIFSYSSVSAAAVVASSSAPATTSSKAATTSAAAVTTSSAAAPATTSSVAATTTSRASAVAAAVSATVASTEEDDDEDLPWCD